jgi:superfamily I DNA/RNA helicase
LIETKNISRHGPSPSLHLGKYQVRHVLAKVKQLINQGYKPEEIAILYRDSDTDDKKSLKTICQLLDESGACSYWITKDNKSKLVYEANTPGVRILTILAAQGLEFKAVILMWTEKFDQDIFANDVATRNAACGELYGGLTRAQEILHLYASPTSRLVQELKVIASLTVVNL